MSSVLERLQKWYQSCCDGQWEHASGVVIGTLDNPGWSIDIDLSDTPIAMKEFDKVVFERSESDWIHCSIENATFKARGGAFNLEEMLERFLDFAGFSES